MKILAAGLAILLQIAAASAPLLQTQRGRIEGVVMRSDSDEPLAGAAVTLATADARSAVTIPVAISDSAGRFVITDIPPGSYTLSAAKNGFARQSFGQRQPSRPGAPITLAVGDTLRNVAIRMVQTASIAGRLRNPRGSRWKAS